MHPGSEEARICTKPPPLLPHLPHAGPLLRTRRPTTYPRVSVVPQGPSSSGSEATAGWGGLLRLRHMGEVVSDYSWHLPPPSWRENGGWESGWERCRSPKMHANRPEPRPLRGSARGRPPGQHVHFRHQVPGNLSEDRVSPFLPFVTRSHRVSEQHRQSGTAPCSSSKSDRVPSHLLPEKADVLVTHPGFKLSLACERGCPGAEGVMNPLDPEMPRWWMCLNWTSSYPQTHTHTCVHVSTGTHAHT